MQKSPAKRFLPSQMRAQSAKEVFAMDNRDLDRGMEKAKAVLERSLQTKTGVRRGTDGS